MRLLVLAGGFGTRLSAAVVDVPKALAPINGVPFLHLQFENWISQGLRKFTFLLHHRANQIIDFLQSHQAGLLKDCQIDWLIEPIPMGTGGGVAHAVKKLGLKNDFLMTNADTWLSGGVREMMESLDPAIAVVNFTDIGRYGQVHINHLQRVTAFEEKKSQHISGYINAGLYHLNANLFRGWNGKPFSLERDLFAQLAQRQRLVAVRLQTDFIDIGVPADYYRFCNWVDAGRNKPI